MQTIALYNLKGGVGKTTSAVNLAYLSAESKKNTVLWDWDPQAAASWYFHVEPGRQKAIRLLSKGQPIGSIEVNSPFPRLKVIPADLSLRKVDQELAELGSARRLIRKMVAPLGEDTAYLIYDCPPTLSPAIEYLLNGVDLVLVPMIPSPLSIRAMEQVEAFFDNKKQAPKRIVGFFTQVDLRRKLHVETLKSVRKFPFPVLKTWIPIDSAAEQMGLKRAPLTSYARSGRAAEAYIKLWREVNRVLKKPLDNA